MAEIIVTIQYRKEVPDHFAADAVDLANGLFKQMPEAAISGIEDGQGHIEGSLTATAVLGDA